MFDANANVKQQLRTQHRRRMMITSAGTTGGDMLSNKVGQEAIAKLSYNRRRTVPLEYERPKRMHLAYRPHSRWWRSQEVTSCPKPDTHGVHAFDRRPTRMLQVSRTGQGLYCFPSPDLPGFTTRPRKPSLPIEILNGKLKSAIAKVIDQFTKANDEFENNNEAIKPKTKPTMVDGLWNAKLQKFPVRKKMRSHRPNGCQTDAKRIETFGKDIQVAQKQVMKASILALSSGVTSGSLRDASDDKQRALKKFKTAFENAEDIFRKLPFQYDCWLHC